MKFLKSPAIVAVLAVVAVLLLVKTTFLPLFKRSGWGMRRAPTQVAAQAPSQPPPVAKEAEGSAPSVATESASKTNDLPQLKPLDVPTLIADSAHWVEAPRRDPFKSGAAPNALSAREQLKLNAIWRQSGSTLVVINNRVMSQGEIIQGFTLDRIEADRVWVKGPSGMEALDFNKLAGPPRTQPSLETALSKKPDEISR